MTRRGSLKTKESAVMAAVRHTAERHRANTVSRARHSHHKKGQVLHDDDLNPGDDSERGLRDNATEGFSPRSDSTEQRRGSDTDSGVSLGLATDPHHNDPIRQNALHDSKNGTHHDRVDGMSLQPSDRALQHHQPYDDPSAGSEETSRDDSRGGTSWLRHPSDEPQGKQLQQGDNPSLETEGHAHAVSTIERKLAGVGHVGLHPGRGDQSGKTVGSHGTSVRVAT